MPRGPAPKTLTKAQKAELETLASVLTMKQIADYFKIGATTLDRMMQRDPEIAEIYKKGRANVILDVANNLITLARGGDLGAICFFLKTQAGWRETNRTEHTGPEGQPLGINVNFIDSKTS